MATDLSVAPQTTTSDGTQPMPGARLALLLLLSINLFNYIDRQVLAALELPIQRTLFPNDPITGEEPADAKENMGMLATAFMVSYMLLAPVFGWLGDRWSRWPLVGIGVVLWSLASGASGLAATFAALLLTRCFVGVGEAAYGPVAPTIISDLYPIKIRGYVLAWFYMAIPVGSALGYVLGGLIFKLTGDWRHAFFVVVPPGLLLGLWCFFMRSPRRGQAETSQQPHRHARLADYKHLLRNRSYVLNTLGMTAMTFAIGGIGFWMPHYVAEARGYGELGTVNIIFGGIVVVAGLGATLLGGILGDRLRERFPGSYFLVSGTAMLVGFPLLLLVLVVPFPWAWIFVFLAVFCLFFNTGPTNTILANVTHPAVRASAFALNIFVIHALGDAISPWVIGAIASRQGFNVAFAVMSVLILVGGLLWLWGARYLERDTALAPTRLD
jgi:MFS family permease